MDLARDLLCHCIGGIAVSRHKLLVPNDPSSTVENLEPQKTLEIVVKLKELSITQVHGQFPCENLVDKNRKCIDWMKGDHLIIIHLLLATSMAATNAS
ncbi:2786_t:CDS:2 [Entrophospora sp. SA101]|nr:2786_t:CDS:2 [Entrophospora sp. SA101]